MRQFKPKMSGGDISPEAHKEWAKQGKLMKGKSAGGAKSAQGNKVISKGGVKGLKPIEKAQIAKSKHSPSGSLNGASKGKSGVGYKTGPQYCAGKGAEGMVKGPAPAGKLNSGNGLHPGKTLLKKSRG